RFWSDWKTSVSICALEIWLLFTLFNTYSIIKNIKIDIEFTHPIIIFPLICIFFLNYFLFIHTDKWKEYNEEFNQLPRYKNIIGGIIVWVIIIAIIAGFFTSAYLVQKNVLGM